MEVRCERCNARYTVDDALVDEAAPAVRCSRCGYLFRAQRPQAARRVEPTPPAPAGRGAPAVAPELPARAAAVEAERDESTFGEEAEGGSERWEVPSGPAGSAEPAWASGAPAPLSEPRPTGGRRPAPPRRRGSPWPWVLLVLVLVGTAGGAIYLLHPEGLPGATVPVIPPAAAPAAPPPAAAPQPPPTAAAQPQNQPEPQPSVPAAPVQPVAPPPEPPAPTPAPPPAPGATAAPEPKPVPEAAPAASTEPKAQAPAPAPAAAPKRPAQTAAERRASQARARTESLLASAKRMRDRGQAEAALDLYGQVLQGDAANADALAGRGLCYLDLSRYDAAEESLKEALRVDAQNGGALLGLAETYRYEGRRGDALTYYRQYLAAHPDGAAAEAARKAVQALEESQ